MQKIKFLMIYILINLGFSINSSFIPLVIKLKKYTLEDYLPAIIQQESQGYVWATSYRGASYGRGLYQISEIVFTQWTWYHMNHWVVKQNLGPSCLYNTNVGREIALWYLNWLNDYYSIKGNDKIYWILSGYNKGASNTDATGINWDYVNGVLYHMQKIAYKDDSNIYTGYLSYNY